MSLSARERNNPPSRRKSCAACTKAKRRCDFAVPACLRCSQRSIPCQYPLRKSRVVVTSPPRTGAADMTTRHLPTLAPSVPLVTHIETTPEDFDAAITSIDSCWDGFSAFDLPEEDSILDLVEQQPFMLSPPSSKDLDAVSEVIANRLQWAVDRIQEAPKTMVLETQTPWSHPFLWREGMPRSMQDAHASCALYMAKNRVNAPVILRSIEAKVQDLLASPLPQTPRDGLAHTQALLLYQIIRLFDGDITARAAAERTIPSLEASAISLLGHIDFDIVYPASLPLFPVSTTKRFWQDWIFQESSRRTLLLTFYLLQAYRFLSGHKGLQCDGRLGLCHFWTFSAHLWGAESAVAFARLWDSKKNIIVSNGKFDEVLSKVDADDVDLFGKIFVSSALGKDEAEGWFASKGGKL